jgi:hypothetical protein
MRMRFFVTFLLAGFAWLAADGAAASAVQARAATTKQHRKQVHLQQQAKRLRDAALRLNRRGSEHRLLQKVQARLKVVEKRLQNRTKPTKTR